MPEQAEDGKADHVVEQAERGRPRHDAGEDDDDAQVVAGHGGGHREVVALDEFGPQDEAPVQQVEDPLADDEQHEDDGQIDEPGQDLLDRHHVPPEGYLPKLRKPPDMRPWTRCPKDRVRAACRACWRRKKSGFDWRVADPFVPYLPLPV